jgi:hypothetical protein
MLPSPSVSRPTSCTAYASCLVAAAAAVASAADPVPINVGARRQLFVDRHIIERLEGEAGLVLHHPQPQEIVLRCDQPWERSGPGYPTVFRDGERYRLYYRVSAGQVDDGDQRQYTCYAESVDGITWEKPRLGLVEIDGSKDNNVIWTGAIAHNFSPFLDENPAADATERYKAVGGVGMKWGDGFWLLVSPDGIRWRKRDDTPLALEGRFDSHNLLFWDAEARLYRMYWRDHRRDDGRQPGGRDVRTATSPDCRNWTASQWLVYEPPGAAQPNVTRAIHRAITISFTRAVSRPTLGRRACCSGFLSGIQTAAGPARPISCPIATSAAREPTRVATVAGRRDGARRSPTFFS